MQSQVTHNCSTGISYNTQIACTQSQAKRLTFMTGLRWIATVCRELNYLFDIACTNNESHTHVLKLPTQRFKCRKY